MEQRHVTNLATADVFEQKISNLNFGSVSEKENVVTNMFFFFQTLQ